MCLPLIGAWGLLNLVQFLDIGGQVNWHKKCSKCAQTSGAYTILMIDQRSRLGQAFPDFGETRLNIAIGTLGME